MFKITCMKCGKEVLISQGGPHMAKEGDGVDVYSCGYDGQIEISCECGNTIQDEY